MEFILCENVKEEKKRRIELMKLHKKNPFLFPFFIFKSFMVKNRFIHYLLSRIKIKKKIDNPFYNH